MREGGGGKRNKCDSQGDPKRGGKGFPIKPVVIWFDFVSFFRREGGSGKREEVRQACRSARQRKERKEFYPNNTQT